MRTCFALLSLLAFALFVSLPLGCQGPSTQEKATEGAAESALERSPDGGEIAPESLTEGLAEVSPETPVTPSFAVVLNSDFTKTTVSLVDLPRRSVVTQDFDPKLPGDVIGRLDKTTLFLLVRRSDPSQADSVEVFDLKEGKRTGTIALPPKANPQDIAVSGGKKAYIALYDRPAIAIADLETFKTTGEIDLSLFAEESKKKCTKSEDCQDGFGGGSGVCVVNKGLCQTDGLPEISGLWLQDKTLYALIQGLDRNDGYKPTASKIVSLDLATDQVKTADTLAASNPASFLTDPRGGLGIVHVGDVFSAQDGGIERFDPITATLGGSLWLKEADLGGSLPLNGAIALVSERLGFALLSDPSFKSTLLAFQPTTGARLQEILPKGDLSHLALTQDKLLLVGDKAPAKSGLWLIQTSGSFQKEGPLSVSSLPPVQILVTDHPSPRLP